MSACRGVGRSDFVAEDEVKVALAQVFLEQGEIAAGLELGLGDEAVFAVAAVLVLDERNVLVVLLQDVLREGEVFVRGDAGLFGKGDGAIDEVVGLVVGAGLKHVALLNQFFELVCLHAKVVVGVFDTGAVEVHEVEADGELAAGVATGDDDIALAIFKHVGGAIAGANLKVAGTIAYVPLLGERLPSAIFVFLCHFDYRL